MKHIVLKYGLIAGLILGLSMIIASIFLWDDPSGFDYGELLGYTTMTIALSVIFIGVKSYRDKELNGVIKFGKAFQIGLYISLVSSFLYVATWMVLSVTVAADFMDNYHEYSVQKLNESGASPQEIKVELANWEENKEMYKNPFFRIIITFAEIFPVGIIISLISAAFLKKSKKEEELEPVGV